MGILILRSSFFFLGQSFQFPVKLKERNKGNITSA